MYNSRRRQSRECSFSLVTREWLGFYNENSTENNNFPQDSVVLMITISHSEHRWLGFATDPTTGLTVIRKPIARYQGVPFHGKEEGLNEATEERRSGR